MTKDGLLEGKKILVVDDEADVLQVLEELLPMCRLSKAASFEQARDLLESEPFDLAVLDIMGVDGYKLLEIANSKGVPAVMLTAHAFTPDNIVRSIKEGAVSYVPKDEMAHIADFLADVLEAGRLNENPWDRWQKRLPSSYFEQKFGAAWKDADKDFWDTFKAGLRARSRSDN
ncbi:MAG: response regulator [Deltaproteobacteria bacterium]|nr:response regulator [Deltaproteobacteria bacterium]MBW2102121.1 response regulator [Deltaproteobacteria bacterium]MBW2346731.1 response regulator [Deltaproteobacteria bacterium]